MKWSISTHIGKARKGKENEDKALVTVLDQGEKILIPVLADGAGGSIHGKKASRIAVRVATKELIDLLLAGINMGEAIQEAIQKANQRIYKEGIDGYTTLVVGAIQAGKLWLGHVGDSRAYRVSKENITQLTRDHSLVQQMVEEGKITSQVAQVHPKRKLITRSVGSDKKVEVDLLSTRLYREELLLFCSDGLVDPLPTREARRIYRKLESDRPVGLKDKLVTDRDLLQVIRRSTSLQDASHKLVNLANSKGGGDNITVILIRPEGGLKRSVVEKKTQPLREPTGFGDRMKGLMRAFT